jgi:predicted oxidoreductase
MEIKTKLAANLEVSRIVLGMWRLLDWNKFMEIMNVKQLLEK